MQSHGQSALDQDEAALQYQATLENVFAFLSAVVSTALALAVICIDNNIGNGTHGQAFAETCSEALHALRCKYPKESGGSLNMWPPLWLDPDDEGRQIWSDFCSKYGFSEDPNNAHRIIENGGYVGNILKDINKRMNRMKADKPSTYWKEDWWSSFKAALFDVTVPLKSMDRTNV
jgi:hypothetical protein